jgi:hypothetical protein
MAKKQNTFQNPTKTAQVGNANGLYNIKEWDQVQRTHGRTNTL